MSRSDTGRGSEWMETLSEALARLERQGYVEGFQAKGGELRALGSGRRFCAAELVVDEVVRFEGESDPQDAAILFALRSTGAEQLRGTLVASYGPSVDPETAETVTRLAAAARGREVAQPPGASPSRRPGRARL